MSRAVLQLECEAPLVVGEVRDFLSSLNAAYEGCLAAETLLKDSLNRDRRSRGRWPAEIMFVQPPWALGGRPSASLFVKPQDALLLQQVQLSSPGFWGFLGSLTPLETIRVSLNDKHRRRQDRAYREAAERQQLEHENELRETEVRRHDLENDILEIELWRQRIGLAREMGTPESEITALFNGYVYPHLSELDAAASRIGIVVGELRLTDGDEDQDSA